MGINPCDTGRPPHYLAMEFPQVDLSCLAGEAWIKKEPPDHHTTWRRLERFTRWCAERPEAEAVVVAHQNVCFDLFGAFLDHCDVLGVCLHRAELRWEPFCYENAKSTTLQRTATKGSYLGMSMLLAGGDPVEKMSRDLGDGWPALHFAA